MYVLGNPLRYSEPSGHVYEVGAGTSGAAPGYYEYYYYTNNPDTYINDILILNGIAQGDVQQAGERQFYATYYSEYVLNKPFEVQASIEIYYEFVANYQKHPEEASLIGLLAVSSIFFYDGDGGPGTPDPGKRPPNLSPQGAGRRGAFRQAKRDAGIPVGQKPVEIGPNLDRRGNIQPGRVYDFEVPGEGGGVRRIRIREDAGGDYYGPNDPQNRGPHFNLPKELGGGHYDY